MIRRLPRFPETSTAAASTKPAPLAAGRHPGDIVLAAACPGGDGIRGNGTQLVDATLVDRLLVPTHPEAHYKRLRSGEHFLYALRSADLGAPNPDTN